LKNELREQHFTSFKFRYVRGKTQAKILGLDFAVTILHIQKNFIHVAPLRPTRKNRMFSIKFNFKI
jgi:hypothetical protein